MNLCLKAAYAYTEAGLSVLPAGQDKRPIASWKDRQVSIPDKNQVTVDFNAGALLGIICGKVSGNLEVIDFDKSGRDYDKWAEDVEKEVPGLVEKLVKQQTQSGGFHIAFRCSGITTPGNQKLATDPDGSVSIETRGEGGYVLAYPSTGYDIKQGLFSRVPDITASERAALILTGKLLDKKRTEGPVQYRAPVIPRETKGDAPGDDFNARGDVESLLEKHGWTRTRSTVNIEGGGYHWRRPGKRDGQSATLFANNHFYIFSSNAVPFDCDRVYDPFGVYTILEHGGDFKTAAKALGSQGYGK